MPTHAATAYDRLWARFALVGVLWGALALLLNWFVDLQLLDPSLNLAPYFTFGRLKPTSNWLFLFAFAANILFCGVYFSASRLLAARPSLRLSSLHFWGWQLLVSLAVVTLLLGFRQARGLGEPEWLIDIAILLLWLIFATNFFDMVRRRSFASLPIPVWFYIAGIVGFGLLHVWGNVAMPSDLLRSTSVWSAADNALVNAWFRSAVATYLVTLPLVGLVYHALSEVAETPVYSRRLAIVQFWGLIFVSTWSGTAALCNTTMPDWMQSLGTVSALLLLAPTWAGPLNALLTLRRAEIQPQRHPCIPFFVVALLVWAMAALHQVLLATKTFAAYANFSDWSAAQEILLTSGWQGIAIFGVLCWLIPQLLHTSLRSRQAVGAHLYLSVLGLLLAFAGSVIAGVTQSIMLRAQGATGELTYDFISTVNAIRLPLWGKTLGGFFYVSGFLVMAWNLLRTAHSGRFQSETLSVLATRPSTASSTYSLMLGAPVLLSASILGLLVLGSLSNSLAAFSIFLVVALLIGIAAIVFSIAPAHDAGWHRRLESNALAMTVLVVVSIVVSSSMLFLPGLRAGRHHVEESYSPQQLLGREIYLREGCHECHTQVVRPFTWEATRYGEVSSTTSSLLGVRRIGPDLARLGRRHTDQWLREHVADARNHTPASTMPGYPHLFAQPDQLNALVAYLQTLGVSQAQPTGEPR